MGGFLSADFVPAPTQYRWVKVANSSHGTKTDADQGAAWQSILTNITWNEKTKTSPILKEMRHVTNESRNLSIRFYVDNFNESPSDPYFGWGRIIGINFNEFTPNMESTFRFYNSLAIRESIN